MDGHSTERRDFLKQITALGAAPIVASLQPDLARAGQKSAYDPSARFELKVTEVEFLRTPRGRQLMARVYQPQGAGPFPTVLDLHGCHDATVRVGVVYPHQEIGDDPARIAAFAQAAEDLGYAHIVAYDHVVGADPTNRPSWWKGAYTNRDSFHEPFVLFGYLAAVTKKLELAFGIVILPQRQTVLVAKQAATLDVLSRGRVRLGAGIGWNHVEYEALGMNWRDRAKRIEEQIEVLRLLWTQELVDYTGRWHRIDRAGIKPLPVQRPIPLWMGADEEVAVKRVARLADGWFSHLAPNEEGRAGLERFRGYVREAGRDPARVGVEGRVAATGSVDEWVRQAEVFRDMGMTHLELRTAGSGFRDVDAHIDAMRRFKESAPVF